MRRRMLLYWTVISSSNYHSIRRESTSTNYLVHHTQNKPIRYNRPALSWAYCSSGLLYLSVVYPRVFWNTLNLGTFTFHWKCNLPMIALMSVGWSVGLSDSLKPRACRGVRCKAAFSLTFSTTPFLPTFGATPKILSATPNFEVPQPWWMMDLRMISWRPFP